MKKRVPASTTTRKRIEDLISGDEGKSERSDLVKLAAQSGAKEDTVSCKEFLRDLKSRGLADPVLVVTDGAPGLSRAVEEVFPRSLPSGRHRAARKHVASTRHVRMRT